MMELIKDPTDPLKQVSNSATAEVLWLPGLPFVNTWVDCPAHLSPEDHTSILELAVESQSPFPLDQLYWGYFQASRHQRAWLFMGLNDRFEAYESSIKEAKHVFPAFLVALHQTADHNCIRLVASDQDLSAVWMEAGNPIPQKLFSRRFDHWDSTPPPHTPAEMAAAARRFALELNPTEDFLIADTVLLITEAHVESGSSLRVSITQLNWQNEVQNQHVYNLLTGENLYACDIRDALHIQKLKRHQKINRRLWHTLQGCLSLTLLWAICAVGLLGSKHELQRQKTRLSERAPAVERVEQKEILLKSLGLFSVAALQPFEALERMNDVRPDALYFTSLQAGADRQEGREAFSIKLKAVASSAAQADTFANQLRQDPFFSKVQLSKLRSKTRRTDFDLEASMPATTQP